MDNMLSATQLFGTQAGLEPEEELEYLDVSPLTAGASSLRATGRAGTTDVLRRYHSRGGSAFASPGNRLPNPDDMANIRYGLEGRVGSQVATGDEVNHWHIMIL